MQVQVPQISKKAITVLITLGIIGLVYVFYFLGYVKNNEKAYQTKAFRILDKIGQNVTEKHENNKKNATSIVQIVEQQGLLSTLTKKEANRIPFLNDKIAKHASKISELENEKTARNEELKEAEATESSSDDDHYQYIKFLIDGLSTLQIRINEEYNEKNKFLNEKESLDMLNSDASISYEEILSQYSINRGLLLHEIEEIPHKDDDHQELDRLFYKETTIDKQKKEWFLTFEKPLDEFFNSILRKDVFDELIVVRGKDLSYQTFSNKIRIDSSFNLLDIENGLRSANTRVFTIEGIAYKMFLYNLNFDNEEDWLIIGCIQESRYLSEIRSINYWVIAYSAFAVLLLIIGMPIFKLAFMNSIERLNISNIVLTGLALIIGAPLLIVSFLIAFNYNAHNITQTDQNLRKFSATISEKFNEELNASYNDLLRYDSILNNELKRPQKSEQINSSLVEKLQHVDLEKNFNELFWIDEVGMQKIRVTSTKENAKLLIPLKNRAYFQEALQDNFWQLSNSKSEFYLQSIISWTTGEREIAISKKGQHPSYPVVAVTGSFESVIDAIVPLNYGFSIIKPDGEVIVHSISDKNLQENFIDESRNDASIKAAIYGKRELKSTINYLGKSHRALIKPIDGTPLSLVVFYKLDDLKSQISLTWMTTLIILLASFMTAGLLVLAIYFIRYKPTKLKSKQFYFNWLSPKGGKKHLLNYKKLILSNCLVIALVVIIGIKDQEQVSIVFRLFILPAIAFTFIHYQLNDELSKKLKRTCVLLGILYLIIIDLFFYNYLGIWKTSHFGINFVFQVLVLLLYLPFNFYNKLAAKIPLKNNVRSTYSIFLLTWLLAGSIIPAIYLYKASNTIESEIWTKYSMLDLNRKIKNGEAKDLKHFEDQIKNGIVPSGVYYEFLDADFITTNRKMNANSFGKEYGKFSVDQWNQSFDTLMFYLRPSYNQSIIENKGLVFNGSSDGSFIWKNSADTILLENSFYNSGIYLTQEVDKLNVKSSTTSNVLFGLVLLSILLYFLYRLISFCVNKIYGIEFEDYQEKNEFDLEQTKSIINNHNLNTIVIGLPGSQKTLMIQQLYKNENDFLTINCLTLNHEDEWKQVYVNIEKGAYKTILIDNFEYKNDDRDIGRKKQELLETLLNGRKHIIMSTDLDPSEIIDSYKLSIGKNESEESKKELEDEIEVWRKLFSRFIEVYKPLAIKEQPCVNKVLKNELKYGSRLQLLCNSLKDSESIKEKTDREEVIIEIQQYAGSYYYSLWNSLSKKEKFAVYDMARDRFINTKNKHVIYLLLKKGLIRYDPNLRLMNESFTNFVLTVVDKKEAMKMDAEVRKKGQWSSLRLVIGLVLLSLIALILFGQPEFFKNMNTVLIALTGVLGVIPTLTKVQSITKGFK